MTCCKARQWCTSTLVQQRLLLLLDTYQRSFPYCRQVGGTLCADDFWSTDTFDNPYSGSLHNEFVNLGGLLPRFAAQFVSAGALLAVERLASECLAHLFSVYCPCLDFWHIMQMYALNHPSSEIA